MSIFNENPTKTDPYLNKILFHDIPTYNEDYEFFPSQQKRKEIFDITKGLSRYLHDQDIHQLILIDRSARPVYIAVQEYWRTIYPEEKMPSIYFLNPEGFKSKEYMASVSTYETMFDTMWTEYNNEPPWGDVRSQDEITQDFRTSYQELLSHKNERVLLFDACIHSGKTVKPILETMKQNGFTQLKVGVVHDNNTHDVPIAYEALLSQPAGSCYPFHGDFMTNKTHASVKPIHQSDQSKIDMSRRLRGEICRIMKEQLVF